jgi:hypothetical protein
MIQTRETTIGVGLVGLEGMVVIVVVVGVVLVQDFLLVLVLLVVLLMLLMLMLMLLILLLLMLLMLLLLMLFLLLLLLLLSLLFLLLLLRRRPTATTPSTSCGFLSLRMRMYTLSTIITRRPRDFTRFGSCLWFSRMLSSTTLCPASREGILEQWGAVLAVAATVAAALTYCRGQSVRVEVGL